jgi:hypothetical protein
VEPLLQLHPAKVYPDLDNPEPDARENVAPLALSDSVGAVPLPPSSVYVTEYTGTQIAYKVVSA